MLVGKMIRFDHSPVPIKVVVNVMPGMPLCMPHGYNKNGKRIRTALELQLEWQKSGTLHALTRHVDLRIRQSFHNSGFRTYEAFRKLANGKSTICLVCKKEGAKHTCARCTEAVYCSRACQKKDWKRHKAVDCVVAKNKSSKANKEDAEM